MKKIIICITFIPWILFMLSATARSIKELRGQKINKNFIKSNFIKFFRTDITILSIIYVIFSVLYFKASQIILVRILLFISINLYLLLHCIYDKKNKEKLTKKEYNILFLVFITLIIPIIFYIISKKYAITYYIMFGYSLFHVLIGITCSILNKKINIKKKKHEKYL